MFVSVVPIGQLGSTHGFTHLHVLLLNSLHSFVQLYVAYVPCVPDSDVPDGQLCGVQFSVHQQVLLAVPPQPFGHVTVFEPYEVGLLDKGEQLQLVLGVQGGGSGSGSGLQQYKVEGFLLFRQFVCEE